MTIQTKWMNCYMAHIVSEMVCVCCELKLAPRQFNVVFFFIYIYFFTDLDLLYLICLLHLLLLVYQTNIRGLYILIYYKAGYFCYIFHTDFVWSEALGKLNIKMKMLRFNTKG